MVTGRVDGQPSLMSEVTSKGEARPTVVHLHLTKPIDVDPGRSRELLGDRAEDWLGSRVDLPRPGAGLRRYLTDLALSLGGQASRVLFRKATFVDLGPVMPIADGWALEINWSSATLAPLFPVFAGYLSVTPSTLTLDGYYAPPGGEVGLALDRLVLHVAARSIARWLLDRVAEALTQPATLR